MECIACGARPPHPDFYARDGWTLKRCARCRLVFLDPQPSAEQMRRAYYHDEEFSRALMGPLRQTTLDRAREKLDLLGSVAGLRILDVGASSGAWMEVAQAAGAQSVTGVEVGASTAAAARERGLDVRTGTLQQVAPEGPFDLVCFWDVLEHLPDPRLELRAARELLAPQGHVAATFPNVEGLYPRLTHALIARRTGVWEHPEIPVHFFDFAPGTATRVFAGAGLTVDRVQTFAIPFDVYARHALSPERVPSRRLRLAFDALHRVAYPLARLTGRGNAQLLTARK